jgi:hypothetical protein
VVIVPAVTMGDCCWEHTKFCVAKFYFIHLFICAHDIWAISPPNPPTLSPHPLLLPSRICLRVMLSEVFSTCPHSSVFSMGTVRLGVSALAQSAHGLSSIWGVFLWVCLCVSTSV